MILTGEEIRKEVEQGDIAIWPFIPENIQPASIDLTLGSQVRVYAGQVADVEDSLLGRAVESTDDFQPGETLFRDASMMDSKVEQEVLSFDMEERRGFVIKPGILYLMHTAERIHTNKYVSVLDGKSSIGRLGVVVHLTAGYGDPGFDGQYTLEVTCVHPVILYPGMKIAQMRFHTMQGELNTSYATKGHYVGKQAMGAIPSMAHKQFGDKT